MTTKLAFKNHWIFYVNILKIRTFFNQYFHSSVIEEANWLTLYEDIKGQVRGGFDAVICLGNSFAHMNDNYGDQREQKQAIKNFEKCLKPGGILFIDHRNYDAMMNGINAPSKSIYYNVSSEWSFHFFPCM